MNVNEPETRGVALALHVVLDDLGKGVGPALVAVLITALGRQLAFSLSIAGWVPCGMLIRERFVAVSTPDGLKKSHRCERILRRDFNSFFASMSISDSIRRKVDRKVDAKGVEDVT